MSASNASRLIPYIAKILLRDPAPSRRATLPLAIFKVSASRAMAAM